MFAGPLSLASISSTRRISDSVLAAEAALGRVLRGYKRSSYILATKLFFPMSAMTDRGPFAAQIFRKQFDASLTRLQTDYVDLYQCHRYDHETALDETMNAMTGAVRCGKARYIGFSEWTAAAGRGRAENPGH